MSGLVGDWKKAGILLKCLPASLSPVCHAKLYETGEIVLERMIGHINNQDLPWQPLSEVTIQRKGGSTVYVDTGYLKEELSVRRVKNSPKRSTIFIGASPWKVHKPSGMKFSDIMLFLEYGTRNIPARPLVRPTWEEVQKEVQKELSSVIEDLIEKGGI